MKFNPTKFDKQTKNVISNARKRLKETAYRAADFAIQMLALRYSPVWSGSYVISHRVGINSKNDSGPTLINQSSVPGVAPPQVTPAQAETYRAQANLRVKKRIKLSKMPDTGSLIIYNQVQHALMVETLPDKNMSGNLAPYYPYLKTNSVLREKIYFIIKQVERKYK